MTIRYSSPRKRMLAAIGYAALRPVVESAWSRGWNDAKAGWLDWQSLKSTMPWCDSGSQYRAYCGGGNGIRTHDEVAPITVFKLYARRIDAFFKPRCLRNSRLVPVFCPSGLSQPRRLRGQSVDISQRLIRV